jgi:AcrR family transcriptional regulator
MERKRSVPFVAGRNARRPAGNPANAVAVVQPENRAGRIPAASLAKHEATLLATARGLFYEHGFGGTTIDAVARAAHVSPKTIYGRFGSKEGLFAASLEDRVGAVLASLQAPINSDAAARAALEDFATRLLAATSSPEALMLQRLVIAESARFPELGRAFFEAGPRRGMTTLAAFFARLTAAGHLRVADPPLAAELFAGALLGVPLRAALLGRTPLSRKAMQRRAAQVVEFFLAAYGTPTVR